MTTAPRPTAVVLGADADEPLPGIEAIRDVMDLRFASDAPSLIAVLPGAEALFLWRAPRGQLEDAWDAAGDLEWIHTASAGVDTVLFPRLIDSDVVVTNARGIYDPAIAEWAIGAMLAFATGIHRSIVDQQHRRWTSGRTTERLAGSHVLVVGPGPIGRGTGTRALALGMHVTMMGRTSRPDDTFGAIVASDRLVEVIGEADFVLDALPLTESTRSMFDARAFAAMKPSARFLNVGRGATVDEGALIDALTSGSIAGAALDVFETEPLPDDSSLWTMPSVIVSPHISGDARGWERDVVDLFVRNARRWIEGEPMVNLVDKRAGHGASEPGDTSTE
ncbi:MAG TPA: D-2-hydroxyacid dehydrogenase [Actinomycetota bacterium]